VPRTTVRTHALFDVGHGSRGHRVHPDPFPHAIHFKVAGQPTLQPLEPTLCEPGSDTVSTLAVRATLGLRTAKRRRRL
jgi:hypothetical protein